jgi:hypothetical protein
MLRIQNNTTFLSFSNNSSGSDFSFSLESLLKGQEISMGFANDKGEHTMVNVRVLSFKTSEGKYEKSTWTRFDEVKLEIELLRSVDGNNKTLQKYEAVLPAEEFHEVLAAEA